MPLHGSGSENSSGLGTTVGHITVVVTIYAAVTVKAVVIVAEGNNFDD